MAFLGAGLALLVGQLPGLADDSPPSPPLSPVITEHGEYEGFVPKGDIRRFNGETLIYDIDFVFFKNAAMAKIHFYEYKNHFFATLVAETQGLIGYLTQYRKHYYKSSFEIVDGGRRVRSLKFEREVTSGSDQERTIHFLDYKAGTHFWYQFNNGNLPTNKKNLIPEGVIFEDILGVFYNFRNGVYGDFAKGRNYKIDTIPDKSMKHITAYINTKEEQEKFRLAQHRTRKNEYLLKVRIPKDVFKTESGELIFWTSRHYIPLETTVKDYLLFGDLHAQLKRGVAGQFKD